MRDIESLKRFLLEPINYHTKNAWECSACYTSRIDLIGDLGTLHVLLGAECCYVAFAHGDDEVHTSLSKGGTIRIKSVLP